MKNGVGCVVLTVLAVISPCVWADWPQDGDPNSDPNLEFCLNMLFLDNGPPPETIDAEGGLIGTVFDFNPAAAMWPAEFFGFCADFGQGNDQGVGVLNDCRLLVPASEVFKLGMPDEKHTFVFWFKTPDLYNGTIIRHAYFDPVENPDAWWEIRIEDEKLYFYHKPGMLRMATVHRLDELGVTANTWHHAAIVIDRTVQNKSKIYIDGLEVPVIYFAYNGTSDATIDPDPYDSPVQFGTGEFEYDGLLDEMRVYSRVLSPREVSILYQYNLSSVSPRPIAVLPIPRSTNVSVITDVNWIPTSGRCTSQRVWFGKDPNIWTKVREGVGNTNTIVTLDYLNGGNPLDFNSTYYWRVDSNNSGYVPGPNWCFTTGTGKAYEPNPNVGEDYVEGTYQIADINLAWKGLDPVQNYTVYASTDESLVESGSLSVRKAIGLTVPEFNIISPQRNAIVYWRIDSNYATGMITGDTWNFRTRPYEIIFNTRPVSINYEGLILGPNSVGVRVYDDDWFALTADGNSTTYPESDVLGRVEGTGSDSVLVFDFNTFSFDGRFDIVVVPQYRGQDINSTNPIRPIAIHVNNGGSFYFDGRINISGMDVTYANPDESELKARCGGYPGPKRNQSTSPFSSFFGAMPPVANYWTQYTVPAGNFNRFGNFVSAQTIFVPKAPGYSIWGPGQPDSPPYRGGGGGGYGGIGGDSGRGYWSGAFSGGKAYGDEEIPVPFGGSSGGWGGTESPGGCSGGGGIEIVADGSLTLDTNSVINANGGGSVTVSGYRYPNGGGAGGSVKLIAAGAVTIKGIITANGGKGGNAASDRSERDAGGGGAGGRIAVFYGNSYSRPGTVAVTGGQAGVQVNTNTGLAENGQDGTFLVTSGSPEKASAPTPRNGDTMVYAPTAGTTLTLKWYAGFGAASDVVYFGTVNPPVTQIGFAVTTPTRGQRSATTTVSVDPNKTYYFRVKTDGVTLSDSWTFSTVDWKCEYVSGAAPHVKGPEWDSNGDCVLNDADFWYFAQYWQDSARSVEYTLDGDDLLQRFIPFWLDCFNRTDNGCSDHLW